MKMKETIPHGEEGHIHYPGCEGYAKGGVVSEDAKALADVAESGMPLAADPEMIQGELDAQKKQPWTLGRLFGEKSLTPEQIKAANDAFSARTQTAKDRNPVGNLLHNAGEMAMDPKSMGLPGLLLKKLVNPTTDYVPAYAKGGLVTEEDKDPSIIPEHIKEFVENAHKERRESRPDENWRIKPAEKPESVAPYKRDEDEMAKKPSVLERLKGMSVPKMFGGGEFDVNGGDSDTVKMAGTPPSMASDPAPAADPVPEAPPAPTPAAVAAPKAAPDFMGQANKTMNLSPEQQVGFMKLLGDNAQKSQIGAGIAGIGDAIASGGTLGKVNPGALNKSEELIQGRTKEGLEGMETIRGNAPFDPAIQKSLVTQFHIPAALAGAPRDVIYKMLDPIAQTQLKEAELAAEQSYKKQALDLQKQQVAATIANQQSERRATDVKNKLEHPFLSAAGAIPSVTAGSPENTGPFGPETTRNGKTYEWSPQTGKYHPKT